MSHQSHAKSRIFKSAELTMARDIQQLNRMERALWSDVLQDRSVVWAGLWLTAQRTVLRLTLAALAGYHLVSGFWSPEVLGMLVQSAPLWLTLTALAMAVLLRGRCVEEARRRAYARGQRRIVKTWLSLG